jgi:hypothetical protein
VDKYSNRYNLSLFGSKVRVAINSGGILLDSRTTPSSGAWHHLVGTYDKDAGAGNLKIYVDGILDNSATFSAAIVPQSDALIIGNYKSPGVGYGFSGQIDDVRIYSYALNAAQIKQIYNNGAAVYFK